MIKCTSHFSNGVFRAEGDCEREEGHPGDHQNLEIGWTWNSGGARSIRNGTYDCPTCGTHSVTSDGLKDRKEGDQCFDCDFWDEKEELYKQGTVFVADGNAYILIPEAPRGFGGRKVTIHHEDGRVVGPTAGLWSNGNVPHERRGVLADNATIEWC